MFSFLVGMPTACRVETRTCPRRVAGFTVEWLIIECLFGTFEDGSYRDGAAFWVVVQTFDVPV